ncbi:MAG TPA: DUF4157 domain-containing protein, partial [Myxococcota bacterium]|nr:DUF4157 domain-containing protein [Myxococcota bacterium]
MLAETQELRSDPVRQPGQVAMEVSRSIQARARGHRSEGTESSHHEEEQEEQQKEATVQLKADPEHADRTRASPVDVQRQLGVGSSLPTHVAGRFSSAYNHDFSDVRLHTESQVVQRMGAKALAVGRSIAFAPGQFRPGSRDSDLLIAHELAHIVQQSGGLGTVQPASLDSFEAEADHAAEVAVSGGSVDSFSSVQTAVQCGGEDDPPVATFTVDTEIYAQPEEGRWIRGKISEVREPATTSEEGVLQVSGPAAPEGTTDDGWEYIVDFEADTGYTQLCLLSYNLHDAKVQQNPRGGGRGPGLEPEEESYTDLGPDGSELQPPESLVSVEEQGGEEESTTCRGRQVA